MTCTAQVILCAATLVPLAAGCGSQLPAATEPAEEVAAMPGAPDDDDRGLVRTTRSTDLPAECRGARLDLARLAMSGKCDAADTAVPLPPAIALALASDTVEVPSSKTAVVRVTLTNTGARAAVIAIDASCHFANVAQSAIYDRHGNRLDQRGASCGPRRTCAGQVIEAMIDPGGHAFFDVDVRAAALTYDSKCEALPGRPLEPASYRLVLTTRLRPEPLVATFAVSQLKRIPVSGCAAYARKLAAIAEPDPAQRAEVAADRADQCRVNPPEQTLVDCQLAAPTAEALLDCGE